MQEPLSSSSSRTSRSAALQNWKGLVITDKPGTTRTSCLKGRRTGWILAQYLQGLLSSRAIWAVTQPSHASQPSLGTHSLAVLLSETNSCFQSHLETSASSSSSDRCWIPWSEYCCFFILQSRKPRDWEASSQAPEVMKEAKHSGRLTHSNTLNLPYVMCLPTYTGNHKHNCVGGQWISVRTSSPVRRAHHHLFTLRHVMESASTVWTVAHPLEKQGFTTTEAVMAVTEGSTKVQKLTMFQPWKHTHKEHYVVWAHVHI